MGKCVDCRSYHVCQSGRTLNPSHLDLGKTGQSIDYKGTTVLYSNNVTLQYLDMQAIKITRQQTKLILAFTMSNKSSLIIDKWLPTLPL
jgi:hypothetical protein